MEIIWSDWKGRFGRGFDPNRPKLWCSAHGYCEFRCNTKEELKFHVKQIHIKHLLKEVE